MQNLEDPIGVEPMRHRLKDGCSTSELRVSGSHGRPRTCSYRINSAVPIPAGTHVNNSHPFSIFKRHRPALSTKQGGHLLNANAYSFAKFRLSTGANVWASRDDEKRFFAKKCYSFVFVDNFIVFRPKL